jgi:hypothetical protein
MFIPRLLLKRERRPGGTEKEVPQQQMPFLLNLIELSKELRRSLKRLPIIFAIHDAISCSASLSIWYIAELRGKLNLLLSPMAGEGLDIGKGVSLNVTVVRTIDAIIRNLEVLNQY